MMWMRRLLESDRNFILLSLSTPVLMVLVAFVIAVALTAFGVPNVNSLQSTVAGLAYVYLAIGLVWLPAYLVACCWFWWATRGEEVQDNLLKRLFMMPLIGVVFVWFPSLYFTPVPLEQKARMFPLLALVAIVGGYLWVGLVRLMFRAWRRI